LKTAYETQEIAANTSLELRSQGERLKKIQDDVDEIQDNLNVGERKLRGISSIWGALGNKFRKDNSREHRKKRAKNEKKLAQKTKQKEKPDTKKETNDDNNNNNNKNNNSNKSQSNNDNARTNQGKEEFTEDDDEYRQFIEEQDEDLDELHHIVLNLKVGYSIFVLDSFIDSLSFSLKKLTFVSKGKCFSNEERIE